MSNNTPREPKFDDLEMKIPTNAARALPPTKGRAFGAILILLFLILSLILGGLFYWYQYRLTPPVTIPEPIRPTAEENQEPESTNAEADAESLKVLSTSNELDAISADLQSTNLGTLTNELQAVDDAIKSEENQPPQ